MKHGGREGVHKRKWGKVVRKERGDIKGSGGWGKRGEKRKGDKENGRKMVRKERGT